MSKSSDVVLPSKLNHSRLSMMSNWTMPFLNRASNEHGHQCNLEWTLHHRNENKINLNP
jgi:hypothetical protein